MRVGYLLKKFPRLSETFILNELLALEAAGVEVEIFSLREPDDEPTHAALSQLRAPVTVVRPRAEKSVFRLLENWSRSDEPADRLQLAEYCARLNPHDPWCFEALNFASIIAPLVRERRIDHLHAHFATSAAATAAEVARQTGVPHSFTMHAKDIYRETVDFDLLSQRMASAAFTRTVCEANAAWLREHCSADACARLRVLYNGLDLQAWRHSAIPTAAASIIAVGRLVEKKGFAVLIEALALLRERGRAVPRLVLIGQGEEEARLRALVAKHGLGEHVELTGAVDQQVVRERMEQATLAVAPCLRGSDGNQDALPTVLLEAAALGRPCVATRVAGIPEIVGEQEGGWIIEPEDPCALAEALIEALESPAAVARRGMAARQRAERMFDQHRNIQRLIEWFASSVPHTAVEREARG